MRGRCSSQGADEAWPTTMAPAVHVEWRGQPGTQEMTQGLLLAVGIHGVYIGVGEAGRGMVVLTCTRPQRMLRSFVYSNRVLLIILQWPLPPHSTLFHVPSGLCLSAHQQRHWQRQESSSRSICYRQLSNDDAQRRRVCRAIIDDAATSRLLVLHVAAERRRGRRVQAHASVQRRH